MQRERLAAAAVAAAAAAPMFWHWSKCYYQHEVSCAQDKPGKEHILQVNHSIGQYFHGEGFYEAATEAKRDSYVREFNDQVLDEIRRIRDKAVNIKRTTSGKHRIPTEEDA